VHQGRHFSFFQGGGQNCDRLPRGGAKYEEKQNIACKNTKQSLFFKFRWGALGAFGGEGGGEMPVAPPPK